jgi:hypothetical protein
VLLEPEAFEAAEVEAGKAIEIVAFVPDDRSTRSRTSACTSSARRRAPRRSTCSSWRRWSAPGSSESYGSCSTTATTSVLFASATVCSSSRACTSRTRSSRGPVELGQPVLSVSDTRPVTIRHRLPPNRIVLLLSVSDTRRVTIRRRSLHSHPGRAGHAGAAVRRPQRAGMRPDPRSGRRGPCGPGVDTRRTARPRSAETAISCSRRAGA